MPTLIGIVVVLAPVGVAAVPAFVATFALDLAVLAGAWFALRPGPPDVRSKDELRQLVHGGRPSVVELYSNYCLICMANRQTMPLAASALGMTARFARVELPTAAGAEIGDAHGVRYVPSYLVFDEHGDLVRTVIPDNVTPLANGYRVLDERGQLMTRLTRVGPEDLVAMVRSVAP